MPTEVSHPKSPHLAVDTGLNWSLPLQRLISLLYWNVLPTPGLPSFPGLSIRAEGCKNIVKRKDIIWELGGFDSSILREILTSAERDCISRTCMWKHTFRKAPCTGPELMRDPVHCLVRVWENSEMAPPSHVEFFRPHERMRGGLEKPWCDREETSRGSSRMTFTDRAMWKQLECRKSKHESSSCRRVAPPAQNQRWA